MAQGQEASGDPGRVARRYLVSGRVQGVGFRYFVLREAQRLGLGGWVRNLPSGQVEVGACGSKPTLELLERSLRKGARFSQVTNVEIDDIPVEVEFTNDFQIIG